MRKMEPMKTRKKGLFIQALEDGVKKAVEMSAVTLAIGYSPQIIILASVAVFFGSFTFKTVRFKISERR